MTSKSSFLLVTTILFLVCGVLAIWLVPSPAIVWRSVDPIGYAAWRVRTAQRFTVPVDRDDGVPEAPLDSWRLIAHSTVADSVFVTFASDRNPVARLYGLAGLALHDSLRAGERARRMTRDTAHLSAQLGACAGLVQDQVARLVETVKTTEFANYLLDGGMHAFTACTAWQHLHPTTDAAVYAAILTWMRVQRGTMYDWKFDLDAPSRIDSLLAMAPAPATRARIDRDREALVAEFASGAYLVVDKEWGRPRVVPFVIDDSTFEPVRLPGAPAPHVQLSHVVYRPDAKSALVYMAFSCCLSYAFESILILTRTADGAWVVSEEINLLVA